MEARRGRLLALLRERSFERKRVVLASGKESDFFIDCKQAALSAEGHALIGELLLEALKQFGPCEAVAGVELGGCPLASAVSLISFQRGTPLPALYVRKQTKDHGSQRLIEGDKVLRPGLPVVLLEDVVTTGGSTLKAVAALHGAGAQVIGVVALVDRSEGGAEALQAAGLPFLALTTRADFLSHSQGEGLLQGPVRPLSFATAWSAAPTLRFGSLSLGRYPLETLQCSAKRYVDKG